MRRSRLPFVVLALASIAAAAGAKEPVPSLAAQECNVTIGWHQGAAGETILQIYHAPECRLALDEKRGELLVTRPAISSAKFTSHPQDTNLTERIIALAKSKIGDRYQPAKAGPDRFDCSGFVYYLFRENGVAIPRSSRPQSESGPHLSRDEIRRGDLLFFDTGHRGRVNHSGLYLGDGKFIHSSSGRAYGVTISDLDHGFYRDKFLWGVRKSPKSKP